MFAVVTSVQYQTGGPSQCNKAGKKIMQTEKNRTKLFLSTGDVIVLCTKIPSNLQKTLLELMSEPSKVAG